MGYSEILCHICGVSFNVSRLRTDKEPPSAAWYNTGDADASFVDFELGSWDSAECKGHESGDLSRCFFVRREAEREDGEDEEENGETDVVDDTPPDFSKAEKFFPEDETKMADSETEEKIFEFFPGPDCGSSRGYNGHSISAEAMRGCNTCQALMIKPEDWKAEDGEEIFETSSDWLLTGLNHHMPSRDTGTADFEAMPHGTDIIGPENITSGDELGEYAMPFHPPCLEIFKRASIYRHGMIDIEGLCQWWDLEAGFKTFHKFPRYEGVKSAQQQWWDHIIGDEFLAANPCLVPGLESFLSAKCSGDSEKGDRIAIGPEIKDGEVAADKLLKLPNEIRLMVVHNLDSVDIANLRFASRAFWQLPQSLFRELTLRECPWLYEAWSSLPLSIWTTAKEFDGRGLPRASSDDQTQNQTRSLSKADYPIDWYQLRTQLTRNSGNLPGLKNRRRIWKDCQEILNRIDAYREKGEILPSETV